MTTSESAARVFFPPLVHKIAHWSSVPEPAFLVPAATSEDSVWTFSADTRLSIVVRGGDAATRENISAHRPQDGTPDFSIEPSLLATVVTNEDSAGHFSADASYNTAVRRSDTFTRPFSTGGRKTKPHLLLVHVRTMETGQTTALASSRLLWLMLAIPALVALAVWHATPSSLLHNY